MLVMTVSQDVVSGNHSSLLLMLSLFQGADPGSEKACATL